MNKINALFFILMILPAFLSLKPSLLQMIEKIPESKNIMNAIHLQMKMKGDNLERGNIMAILKAARDNADKLEAEEKEQLKIESKACESDLTIFQNMIVENQKWQFTIGRHSASNTRQLNTLKTFIERTNQERSDYTDLTNIVKSSWTQWTSFQNATIADFRKVRGILDNAREQLHSLSNSSNASFLQVSENSQYFTNLNEIRVNFENTNVELQGFRPVITKLLELMSRSSAVNQEEVRKKLIGLFHKIAAEIENMENEVEANKARQDSIFNAILESYKENLLRVDKILERLNKEQAEVSKRQTDLTAASSDSLVITKLSSDIFTSRKKQCYEYFEGITRLGVEATRTRNVVAQISEILEERFGNLKSYFIQRSTSFLQK